MSALLRGEPILPFSTLPAHLVSVLLAHMPLCTGQIASNTKRGAELVNVLHTGVTGQIFVARARFWAQGRRGLCLQAVQRECLLMTKGRGTALHRLRRWCFLFILGFKRLTGYHCLAFLALFMIGTVIATIANDHPEAGWISTIRPAEVTLVHDVPDLDDNFQPLDEVAWAIPVGGRYWRGILDLAQRVLSSAEPSALPDWTRCCRLCYLAA